MPPPDKDILAAALGALRDDAKTWDSISQDLESAKRTAERLDLDALHFSYIADKLGLTTLYKEIQDKMVRLLGEGAANDKSVAEALLKSAATYEQEEKDGVHRIKGVW